MSLVQDFEIWNDNDVLIDVPVTDGATGEPLPLTGATIYWSIFSLAKLVALAKSTAAGITVLAAPNDHTFRITVQPSETVELVDFHYLHEGKVIIGGKEVTVVSGHLTIQKSLLAIP